MTMVMIPEVVSPEKMGLTSAMIGMTLGCSGVLGPILGGVISHFTTWRWIFYIKYDFSTAKLFISNTLQHTSWLSRDREYSHRVAADTWITALFMGRIPKYRFYWNFTYPCRLSTTYLGL